jgi:HSP20 family protein
MALIRYAPARSYGFATDVNRLFGSLFDTPTGPSAGTLGRWAPATDLVETESEYVLKADLPGLTQEDVSIDVDDNVLTVSGERKSEREERKDGYYRIERASGSFRRSLRLPEGVDAAAIEAKLENGVLEVHVPKPEQRKPQKVAITVGSGQPAVEAGEPVADES